MPYLCPAVSGILPLSSGFGFGFLASFVPANFFFGGSTGGAGLGLSIALWIVNQHQGAIEVQSQANQGTTFTVRLPIADLTGVRNQPF